MKNSIVAIAALCATMMACNSNKNQNPNEWLIENDVWEYENIDFDDIAEVVDIKPIVSDEPIADLRLYMSGINNDFIISDQSKQILYHIMNGQMTEKLQAVGNGPTEYNYLDCFSYLPADSLFYGFDRRGRIICFKTSPFKFVLYFPTDYRVNDMIALGHNRMLLTAVTPNQDSCAIYEFDGKTMKKLNDVKNYALPYMFPFYSRSGNDVMVVARQENASVFQYDKGRMQKVATIDYGNMELTEDKEYETDLGNGLKMINWKDHARGCKYAQFNGSTLAYWYMPVLKEEPHRHLTIATRNSIRNYEVHIEGLNFEVNCGMVDNGVYTMLIQGGWESKINPDEELSATGKRIIEALKNNNDNPIYLQFKLKDKYLNK